MFPLLHPFIITQDAGESSPQKDALIRLDFLKVQSGLILYHRPKLSQSPQNAQEFHISDPESPFPRLCMPSSLIQF